MWTIRCLFCCVCVCVQLFCPCGHLHAVIITGTSRWIDLATCIPLLSGYFVSNKYAPLIIIIINSLSPSTSIPCPHPFPPHAVFEWLLLQPLVGGLAMASYCIATWSVPAWGSSCSGQYCLNTHQLHALKKKEKKKKKNTTDNSTSTYELTNIM